jgi:hypothetical protein
MLSACCIDLDDVVIALHHQTHHEDADDDMYSAKIVGKALEAAPAGCGSPDESSKTQRL